METGRISWSYLASNVFKSFVMANDLTDLFTNVACEIDEHAYSTIYDDEEDSFLDLYQAYLATSEYTLQELQEKFPYLPIVAINRTFLEDGYNLFDILPFDEDSLPILQALQNGEEVYLIGVCHWGTSWEYVSLDCTDMDIVNAYNRVKRVNPIY